MAHQYFAGGIWTHHALERLADRKISQKMAGDTFSSPDKMTHGKEPGTTEFIKKFGDYTVTVIGKHNEKNEWIIVSVWIDPPMLGTKDYKKKEHYKRYKKAGFMGKIWWTLLRQIGF
jgi:hypothetical protein